MGLGLYFAEGEGPRFERTDGRRGDDRAPARARHGEAPLRVRRGRRDQARARRARAADRIRGQPVHARLLHDRRRRQRRLRDGAPDGLRAARPAAAARRRQRPRGRRVSERADRRRRRRGDDLRHLGRTALRRRVPDVLAGADAHGAGGARVRRRTDGPCRRSSSPRAAGNGSTISRRRVRRASGSTGPSTRGGARRVGARVALQGNLDPLVLLTTPDVVRREAAAILRAAGPAPGHIFNLGHGIVPATPPENVAALVEAVHSESRGSPRRRLICGACSLGETARSRAGA